MGIIVKPNNFAASTPAVASQVNANFDVIYNAFNGNIDSNNLATNSVVTSKIADNNVTTAKINDGAVTTAKINNLAVTTDKIADSTVTFAKTTGIWWEEIGRTTLTSAGDTITVSGLPARKYLRLMIFTISTGGTNAGALRFNNDSGTNYTQRYADNDSADGVTSSAASIFVDVGFESTPVWVIIDLVNMTNQEKICIASVTCIKASGSVTAPTRRNTVGKWANTSSQINRIDLINGGTGDFAIGSEVVVLGRN